VKSAEGRHPHDHLYRRRDRLASRVAGMERIGCARTRIKNGRTCWRRP
jgi:hypothetical protein